MSNPGIIFLSSKNYSNFKLRVEDNIGECIHIHINNLRIDLTISEFYIMCTDIENLIKGILKDKNINIDIIDKRFLNNDLEMILNIINIKFDKVKLSSLLVNDDLGFNLLPNSNLLNILCGNNDIDILLREGNFYGQDNKKRLLDALNFIKKNGYPYNDSYIWVIKDKNIIIDGYHRACALYHLYGDIEIQVYMVEFNSSYMSKLILEYNKKNYLNNKTKGCNIALYGAGYFGKLCYNQIKNNNLYNVIGWYDKKFSEIKSVMGVNILDPEQIKNDEFVYIVITIKSKIVCDEIIEFLKNKGISEGKIVCI